MMRRRLGLILSIGAVVAALVLVIAGQGANPSNSLPRLARWRPMSSSSSVGNGPLPTRVVYALVMPST